MKTKNPSTQLKELVQKCSQERRFPAVLVILCPDTVRRERAVRYFLTSIAEVLKLPANRPLSTFSFSESIRGVSNQSAALEEFITGANTPSLFEPHGYAEVKNIHLARAAELEPISELVKAKGHCCTFVVHGAGFPNVPTFKKAITTAEIAIQFEPLKGAELSRWTERECVQSGITSPSDSVVEAIISAADSDPDQISKLVEKLALYLDGQAATVAAVQQLVPLKIAVNDFELADNILSATRGHNELFVEQLRLQGSNAFMTLGLIAKTWSTLLQIKQLEGHRVSRNEMKDALGISPWLLGKYAPLAERTSLATLRANIKDLLEADFRLKDRSCGPSSILGTLVRKLKGQSSANNSSRHTP